MSSTAKPLGVSINPIGFTDLGSSAPAEHGAEGGSRENGVGRTSWPDFLAGHFVEAFPLRKREGAN